jgi:FKBP-type peptidyl-prolyl cis-trans isomerase FkpA
MKYTSLIIGCGLLCSVSAQAQQSKTSKKPVAKSATTTAASQNNKTAVKAEFIKGENELEYKFIHQGSGTPTAQWGDHIEISMAQRIGDSLMFNSNVANGGRPIAFTLQQSPMKGDLTEGLVKMRVGDSAIFRSPIDSLSARSKQPIPEWVPKGAYISWEVKLLAIKTKEQLAAEQAKAAEEAAEKAKVQATTDDQLIRELLAKKGITNAVRTASGLYYVIHEEGEGPQPEAGKKVTVNYTGVNMDGETFDSNVDPAFNHVQPFQFDLGRRNVIAGWDEGIALMKKGGKATLYIPSGLAYGAQSRGPKIPANAILIFDVELVNFE